MLLMDSRVDLHPEEIEREVDFWFVADGGRQENSSRRQDR